ncbi:MAG: YqaJ viral recombinase family protein [Spirochaetota bacterium]
MDLLKQVPGARSLGATSNRDEWLAVRRGGIGGSDAGAIMGLNPYASPLTVWMEKTGRTVNDVDNAAIRFGVMLEPVLREHAAEWIRDEFDLGPGAVNVYELTDDDGNPITLASKSYPFMLANVDGLVQTDNGRGDTEWAVLEIKTAGERQASKWADGEVPDSYYVQVQHYLAVTGLERAIVVALVGRDIVIREVPRNDDFVKRMREAEAEFWAMVREDDPPAPTGREAEDEALLALYPDGEGEVVDASLETNVREYNELGEEIKRLEAERKRQAQTIKAAIGEGKTLIAGEYRASWSRFERSSIDSKRLAAELPDA